MSSPKPHSLLGGEGVLEAETELTRTMFHSLENMLPEGVVALNGKGVPSQVGGG